jgi:hypothetical protein
MATVLAAASPLVACTAQQGPTPGTLAGRFVEMGGPPTLSGQTPQQPLPGQVVAVNSAGAHYSVSVGKDGRFSLSLPSGTYHLAGKSPLWGNGKHACPAGQTFHVAAGRTTRGVLVICPVA